VSFVLRREVPPPELVGRIAWRLGHPESAMLRVIGSLARLTVAPVEVDAIARTPIRREPPCVRLTSLPIHAEPVRERFAAIVEILRTEGLVGQTSARALLARAPEAPALAECWMDMAASAGGREALAVRIAGVAMSPLLRRVTQGLEPALGPAVSASGHCPYCAGEPDFATTGAGARVLYCARCDGAWRAPRRGCPFCGEAASGRVAFHRCGERPYGLSVCASCRHYLKSVEAPASGYLAVERALSAPLDSGARAAGLVG
jgi:hypothetical protein